MTSCLSDVSGDDDGVRAGGGGGDPDFPAFVFCFGVFGGGPGRGCFGGGRTGCFGGGPGTGYFGGGPGTGAGADPLFGLLLVALLYASCAEL